MSHEELISYHLCFYRNKVELRKRRNLGGVIYDSAVAPTFYFSLFFYYFFFITY